MTSGIDEELTSTPQQRSYVDIVIAVGSFCVLCNRSILIVDCLYIRSSEVIYTSRILLSLISVTVRVELQLANSSRLSLSCVM